MFAVTFTAAAQSDTVKIDSPQPVEQDFDNEALWQGANQAYIDGDYSVAAQLYSQIEDGGYYSARLYYNMGNTYFKIGNLGKAILYYNRALVVSPSMDDARYNLEIAEAQTKDKITEVPQFFLNRWIERLQRTMSCTAWSVVSLVLLGTALALLLIFLLSSHLSLRKAGFYGTIVSALLFIVTTAFALSERSRILNREDAIVMSSAISVKSSPDSEATDLFVLHEGTKVTISSEIEGWAEVTIADGKKGWTVMCHLERIEMLIKIYLSKQILNNIL